MVLLLNATSPALSPWVIRFAGLVRPQGQVLDLACGSGRHLRWLAAEGFQVTGVDRDADALAGLQGLAQLHVADIEGGPWPLPGRRFDGLVVTNYLWRPLWPQLIASLADNGVLICETFATGQETLGKPSRPQFLLQPGELLRLCAGLRVVAFEDGFDSSSGISRFVQRIAAVAEVPTAPGPRRYALSDAAGSLGPGG